MCTSVHPITSVNIVSPGGQVSINKRYACENHETVTTIELFGPTQITINNSMPSWNHLLGLVDRTKTLIISIKNSLFVSYIQYGSIFTNFLIFAWQSCVLMMKHHENSAFTYYDIIKTLVYWLANFYISHLIATKVNKESFGSKMLINIIIGNINYSLYKTIPWGPSVKFCVKPIIVDDGGYVMSNAS